LLAQTTLRPAGMPCANLPRHDRANIA